MGLKNKVINLGNLKDYNYSKIVNIIGQPKDSYMSKADDGEELKIVTWSDESYEVLIAFDNKDNCLGIAEEKDLLSKTNNNNNVAHAINNLSAITGGIGIVLGVCFIFYGFSDSEGMFIALGIILISSSIIFTILLSGFSEIIKLLEDIKNKIGDVENGR